MTVESGKKKLDTMQMLRSLMKNPKLRAVRVSTRDYKLTYNSKVKYCSIKGLCFEDDYGGTIARVSLTPEIMKSTWLIIEPEPVGFYDGGDFVGDKKAVTQSCPNCAQILGELKFARSELRAVKRINERLEKEVAGSGFNDY